MDDLKKLDDIVENLDSELEKIEDLNALQQTKANYLGKKGPLAELMSGMKDLSVEAKKELGMATNKIKVAIEEKINQRRAAIEDAIIKKNHEGYTDKDGKHRTLYECTQVQRRLETKIRKMKDGQIASKTAGNMDMAREYQRKIDKYSAQYRLFSKRAGLPEMKQKLTVSGYRRINY